MTLQALSDPDSIKTIDITAQVVPTDTVVFDLVASRPTFYPGDTISFVITPRKSSKGYGLRDFAFDLLYNGDLLTLQGNKTTTLIPNANYISSLPTGSGKQTSTRIFFQGQPLLLFDSGQSILSLVFAAALTDTITTSISISNVLINGGDSTFAKCVLGLVSTDMSYSVSLQCGDPTLMKFMQTGNASELLSSSVIPDPIRIENSSDATLPFYTSEAGSVRMLIYNTIGVEVGSASVSAPMRGTYSIAINTSRLNAGVYHYLLFHSGNGAVVSGNFVVMK